MSELKNHQAYQTQKKVVENIQEYLNLIKHSTYFIQFQLQKERNLHALSSLQASAVSESKIDTKPVACDDALSFSLSLSLV